MKTEPAGLAGCWLGDTKDRRPACLWSDSTNKQNKVQDVPQQVQISEHLAKGSQTQKATQKSFYSVKHADWASHTQRDCRVMGHQEPMGYTESKCFR